MDRPLTVVKLLISTHNYYYFYEFPSIFCHISLLLLPMFASVPIYLLIYHFPIILVLVPRISCPISASYHTILFSFFPKNLSIHTPQSVFITFLCSQSICIIYFIPDYISFVNTIWPKITSNTIVVEQGGFPFLLAMWDIYRASWIVLTRTP